MDFLKTNAPFWKKEHGEDSSHWVEARKSDDAATEKWQRR
jgi:molybdopterin synthase catalytic subunit